MSEVKISSTGQGADAAALLQQFLITDEDLELVRKIGKKVEPNLSAVVEEFYVWLRLQPFFENFFSSEQRVEEVKAEQIATWREFFDAEIDEAYVESRRAIGTVHARIELPLETYMTGMNIFFESIIEALSSSGKPSARLPALRCLTDRLYSAGRLVLKMSAATFHAPPTYFQTTIYLPSSVTRPSSVSKAKVYQP